MAQTAHQSRIQRELAKVGVSKYGLSKMSSRYLYNIIHEDEHIQGCVYGRGDRGLGMLVATDMRIIFIDRKPLYVSTDELTYDVVNGIRTESQLFFSTIGLHTRIGSYILRYVNPTCARIFVEYIERRVEHVSDNRKKVLPKPADPVNQQKLSAEAREFLKTQDLAVLSTANRTGEINGSVVNYLLGEDDYLYILTRSETDKARNMLSYNQVALTIYDAAELTTVQIRGVVDTQAEPDQKNFVIKTLDKQRTYGGKLAWSPASQLSGGYFVVFRITPLTVKYRSFKNIDKVREEEIQ
jgi:uncharacterized pyridoxamine 5'-phosphate oxidase family protein